jgi:quercetin dioxygenase-like cupin family protein
MTYLTRDEDEYWDVPERLQSIVANRDELTADMVGGEESLAMLRAFRSTQFVLGDPNDDDAPAANVIQMPPGFAIPFHTHPCDVLMFVLKGSLYTEEKILRAGDCMTSRAHDFYGPEVAGPDGCTRVEFFANLRGILEVEYQREDGVEFTNHFLHESPPPNRELAGRAVMRDLVRAVRTDAQKLLSQSS